MNHEYCWIDTPDSPIRPKVVHPFGSSEYNKNIKLLRNLTELFPKISLKRIQVRFCTGYVEVITEKLEPHLNHTPRNKLIINEFNILHREIAETRSN